MKKTHNKKYTSEQVDLLRKFLYDAFVTEDGGEDFGDNDDRDIQANLYIEMSDAEVMKELKIDVIIFPIILS